MGGGYREQTPYEGVFAVSPGREVVAKTSSVDEREIAPEVGPAIPKLPEEQLADMLWTQLVATVERELPESPALYPADAETDLPERFFAAELIREQLLLATHEEVPYQSAVRVDGFVEREGRDLLVIDAQIVVARPSQRAIVIGERGSRLKAIGQRAREGLEAFFGARVYLNLHVKVDPKWFVSARSLTDLGL